MACDACYGTCTVPTIKKHLSGSMSRFVANTPDITQTIHDVDGSLGI